jgi:PAS domain S-box-containing protein
MAKVAKRAGASKEDALKKSDSAKERELSALLEGSRSVLRYRDFVTCAVAIFDSCKNLVGAQSGYIALLSKDGSENELVFLDSGGLPCTVPHELPMPIRGLRAEAYHKGKTVYDNHFPKSRWVDFLPDGHVKLDNVLFAPLILDGRTVGLLGLANKPGGFDRNDAGLATAFGEFAAIALHNSRTLGSLEHSEKRFRAVAQTASDAIISTDSEGNIVFWNRTAEVMFGFPSEEVIGGSLEKIIPVPLRHAHRRGMERIRSAGTSKMTGRSVELTALKKGDVEFPIELSLSSWKQNSDVFFTGIIRDITERKQAEKELQKARNGLERRVEERTSELSESNRLLRQEIAERERAEEALKESEKAVRYLASRLLETQESERKRVARDIHDTLGSSLAAVKFRLERFLSEPEMSPSIEDAVTMIQRTMEEARRIQLALHPSMLDDLGILSTLSWFIREFCKTYPGIRVESELEIKEKEVPKELKTVIYRILQEAFNNIAKHSNADRVRLALRGEDGMIAFTIEDNGIGFDANLRGLSRNSRGGLGLSSMKERAEMAGGSVVIRSEPGKGTAIRATWPGS